MVYVNILSELASNFMNFKISFGLSFFFLFFFFLYNILEYSEHLVLRIFNFKLCDVKTSWTESLAGFMVNYILL